MHYLLGTQYSCTRMKYLFFLLLTVIFFTACQTSDNSNTEMQHKDSDWSFLPLTENESINPIMRNDTTLVFTDPIRQKEVQWATKDVFNPAAIVRNDTLFLLFRAEDNIGKHAGVSRIGLAY